MSQSQQFDLDINLILSQKVNLSAVERRCESIIKRRSVKKKSQVEWLLNTIEFMDLTTLAGDDTPGRVSRLCHKALNPVRKDILNDLGISDIKFPNCLYGLIVSIITSILLKSSEN